MLSFYLVNFFSPEASGRLDFAMIRWEGVSCYGCWVLDAPRMLTKTNFDESVFVTPCCVSVDVKTLSGACFEKQRPSGCNSPLPQTTT